MPFSSILLDPYRPRARFGRRNGRGRLCGDVNRDHVTFVRMHFAKVINHGRMKRVIEFFPAFPPRTRLQWPPKPPDLQVG